MQTDKSRRGVLASRYSERKSHCSDEPQVQTETKNDKVCLLQQKSHFTAAKIRNPNLAGARNPRHKGGAVAILERIEGRTTEGAF